MDAPETTKRAYGRNLLLFLLALSLLLPGYRVLSLWNLYHDFDGKSVAIGTLSGSRDLSVVSGIPLKGLSEDYIATFPELSLIKPGDFPSRFTSFITSAAEARETRTKIALVVDTTLASLSSPASPTQPWVADKPEYLIGGVTDYARGWVCFALASFDGTNSLEVAKILVGVSLIGYLTMYEGFGDYSLMLSIIADICHEMAGMALVTCASRLSLTPEETRFILASIQAIECTIPPVFWVWENREYHRELFGKMLVAGSGTRKSSTLFRWVGKMRGEYMISRDVNEDLEKNYYSKMRSLLASPPVLFSSAGKSFLREVRAAKERVKFWNRYWIRYLFTPGEFYKDKEIAELDLGLSIFRSEIQAVLWLRFGQWALAIHGFHREKRIWPGSQADLENWLGRRLPGDPYSGKELLFRRGDPPDIRSIGPDLAPDSLDDRRIPLGGEN